MKLKPITRESLTPGRADAVRAGVERYLEAVRPAARSGPDHYHRGSRLHGLFQADRLIAAFPPHSTRLFALHALACVRRDVAAWLVDAAQPKSLASAAAATRLDVIGQAFDRWVDHPAAVWARGVAPVPLIHRPAARAWKDVRRHLQDVSPLSRAEALFQAVRKLERFDGPLSPGEAAVVFAGISDHLTDRLRRGDMTPADGAGEAVVVASGHAALWTSLVGPPGLPDGARWEAVWATATARGVADSIHAARTYGDLPVLADALEEAGCDCPWVLGHCRDPHLVTDRGDWVVDLVRGRRVPLDPEKNRKNRGTYAAEGE